LTCVDYGVLFLLRQGFLDSLSEEKLDLVDVIIFDPTATDEIRKEALLFMMDHTQGFDVVDDLEPAAISKGKKKQGKSAAVEANEIQRRKNVALQLETLTEFAEHNLSTAVEWSSLLADACLDTDKAVLLYDWNTVVALLMREQEDLITNALRPLQISTLLHMFVRAATRVTQQKREIESGTLEADDEVITSRWESLNSVLQNKLPLLFTRFKDDEDCLAALTELLCCCDLHSNAKSNQHLLSGLQEIFLSFGDESLLKNIVNAFKRWKSSNFSDPVVNVVRSLVETLWGNLVKTESLLRTLTESETKSSNKKKRNSVSFFVVVFVCFLMLNSTNCRRELTPKTKKLPSAFRL
jgi:hypothetical protein